MSCMSAQVTSLITVDYSDFDTPWLRHAWFPDDQRSVQRAAGGEPLDGRGDERRGQGQS